MENPIIILGCQRSGTTLITTILNQHTDLRAHPKELQIINGLARLYGSQIPNTDKAIQYLCSHKFCPSNVTAARLRQALKQAKSCSLHRLVHAYLQTWHGNDPRRIVLKYPHFVFRLPLIEQLFPKATYLHIVRDPRANVSSQVARWPQTTIWEAAHLWHDAVTAVQAWQQRFPKRTLELRYESLVQQPEATLQTVCQQLDLPYTPQMLSFEMDTRKFTPGKKPEAAHYRGLNRHRLNLWRERFDPVQIRLIEDACTPLMTKYGYFPEAPPVSKAQFWMARWQQQARFAILANGRWLKNRGRQLQRFWRRLSISG